MVKILHYLKDPKLWELWYIPSNGSCRILSINRSSEQELRKKACRFGRCFFDGSLRHVAQSQTPKQAFATFAVDLVM